MGLRFNPPPGWPPVPESAAARPGWQPDHSWPAMPPGWQLWFEDGQPSPGQGFPDPGSPNPEGTFPPGPYPPGPYPGAAPFAVGQPPPVAKTSGWAIASFVLGLLGGVLLSVIFGFVALSRIRRLGQRGRGLAIAGIAMSGAWILLIIIAVAISPGGQSSYPMSLNTGDCFDNPSGSSITSVDLIGCDHAHDSQVFATYQFSDAPDAVYPGDQAVAQRADKGCDARKGKLDPAMMSNSMTVRMFIPTSSDWLDQQRTVVCFMTSPEPNLIASLLKPGAPG